MSPRLWAASALWLGCLAAGCATARPAELVSARQAYAKAAGGDAAQLAPLDLETARAALDKAERAYAANDVDAARDLAYVAARKAELAEARAEETRDVNRAVTHDAPAPTASTTAP